MNPIHENNAGHADDPLESVFLDIEARATPPDEIEQAVYQHFRHQWASQRAAKIRRKRIYFMAMAASVLLVLLLQPLFNLSRNLPDEPGRLGQVGKFAGEVMIRESDHDFELSADMLPLRLAGGQTLDTAADAGLSIQWGTDGKSLRVDQSTVLNLISSTQIELVSGQIYLDIPAVPQEMNSSMSAGDELQVVTRFGTIRHTGTQFAVAVDDEELEVKVREGSVAIDTDSQTHPAQAGVRGTLDEAGNFSSEPVETHGPSWRWVERLAPAYEIEGRSVMDFLGWVQRETGKRCVFDSSAAEGVARDTLIHGASLEMEPMLALDLVLQTNELSWQEQDGEILISLER